MGIKIGQYNSKTMQETINEIESRKIKPSRNLLRMEIVKKRKDFCQPSKFSDTDIDRPQSFAFFKDDNMGFVKNNVMEIG